MSKKENYFQQQLGLDTKTSEAIKILMDEGLLEPLLIEMRDALEAEDYQNSNKEIDSNLDPHVKKTKEKIFNCVASDMALEQSINRDCKSSTGVIGFSRKPAALLRWLVTRHSLGDFSQKFVGKYTYMINFIVHYG